MRHQNSFIDREKHWEPLHSGLPIAIEVNEIKKEATYFIIVSISIINMNNMAGIKEINSAEDAIRISREILINSQVDSNLPVILVSYMTGKARKALSLNTDGWLVSFKLPVPEGFSPDTLWIELYPENGKYVIPEIY